MNGELVKCRHEQSRSGEWLHMNNVVKKHPYCEKCGYVKNLSSDRGRKVSYFVGILHKMKKELEKRGYKISKAQMRLIFRELPEDFGDTWSITYSAQKEMFVEAVTKYVKVSRDFVESFFSH